MCAKAPFAAFLIRCLGAGCAKLRLVCVESRDSLHDEILVCIAEFRINGQRKDFLAGFFGDGKLASAIGE